MTDYDIFTKSIQQWVCGCCSECKNRHEPLNCFKKHKMECPWRVELEQIEMWAEELYTLVYSVKSKNMTEEYEFDYAVRDAIDALKGEEKAAGLDDDVNQLRGWERDITPNRWPNYLN